MSKNVVLPYALTAVHENKPNRHQTLFHPGNPFGILIDKQAGNADLDNFSE